MDLKGIIEPSVLQAIICGAGLVICIGAGAMDIATYERVHTTSAPAEQQELLKVSIYGAGEAYTWANAYLERVGQPLMYCAPRTLTLNADNFVQILDESLERNRATYVNAGIEVNGVLLLALQAKFPCETKKKQSGRK